MRAHTRLIGLTGVLAVAAGVAIGAQAKDPAVGMWMLDTAKSTYKPGPAPKSAMLTIDAAGKGFKVSVDAVGADGKPLKWGYTSEEGKDVPVTGNPAYDSRPDEGVAHERNGGLQKRREDSLHLEELRLSRRQDFDYHLYRHQCSGTAVHQRRRIHEALTSWLVARGSLARGLLDCSC